MAKKEPKHIKMIWMGKEVPASIQQTSKDGDGKTKTHQTPLLIPRPTYSLQRRPSLDSVSRQRAKQTHVISAVPANATSHSSSSSKTPLGVERFVRSNSFKHSVVLNEQFVQRTPTKVPSATKVVPPTDIKPILKCRSERNSSVQSDSTDSAASEDGQKSPGSSRCCYKLPETTETTAKLRKTVSFKDELLPSRFELHNQRSGQEIRASFGVYRPSAKDSKMIYV